MRVLSALLVAVTLAGTINLGMATDVEAKKPRGPVVVPVTGSAPGGQIFSGTVSIERFEARDGDIYAIGMIAGAIAGVGSIVRGPQAFPVTLTSGSLRVSAGIIAQQAPCGILHLEIGGLNLDLLGLMVALDPVVLDIAGEPGPLGDLVCAIVELLGTAADIVGLLNQLLGLLLGLLGGLTPGA